MRLAVRQTGSTSFTGSATSAGTTSIATPPPNGAEPTTTLPAGVSPTKALPPASGLGPDTVGPVDSGAVASNPDSLVSPGPTTSTTTTTTSSTPSSSTPSSSQSTSIDPSATPSSGSSIEVQGPVQSIQMGPVLRGVIIAVVGLLLLLVALFFCRRRIRRRRRVPEFEENLKAAFDSRPTSPDESTVFPVHFSDPASSSTLLVSPVTPQQLRDEKALAIHAAHESKDKSVSGLKSLTLDTAVSSAIGPSTSVSIVGSSQVERQFQASLEARAQRMGLTPRQLLMLLTTSLDNQHVMSDVASSDGASERAFSLVSVPPPAYDSAAAALARQTSTTR